MNVSFTLSWWMIPTMVTVLTVGWALLHDEGGGYLSFIGNMMWLIPALAVSIGAWIVAAILK